MAKGIFIALEDADLDAGSSDELEQSQAEVMEADAEVDSDLGETSEMSSDIEDAEQGAEQLEEIKEVMERSVEEGEGLDENAAEIAEIAVEAICARLGYRKSSSIMPATEEFGSSKSRVAATRVAIESIGETVDKIWTAIKETLKNLWAKISQFAIGLIKNAEKQIKHLENLQDRAKGINGKATMEKNTIDSKGLARGFSINGKANLSTAEEIFTRTKTLLTHGNTFSDILASYTDKVKDAVKSNGFDNSILTNFGTATRNAMSKLDRASGVTGPKAASEKDVEYYGPYAGCKMIAYEASKDATKPSEISLKVETYDKIEANAIDALDKTDIETLLKGAISVMESVKDYQKVFKKMEGVNKAQMKLADEAIKAAQKSDEEDNKGKKSKDFKEIQKANNNVTKISQTFSTQVPGLGYAAGKYAGHYALACIANLKVKD